MAEMDAFDFEVMGVTPEGIVKSFTLDSLLSEKGIVVIYFYPKDNTPGCTTEACEFNKELKEISNYATLVGVSADTIESHKKFQQKYNLQFPLLSDCEKEVIKKYKAFGKKNLYGKMVFGIIRSTFIIDSNKKILKSWHKVSPKGHAEEVLKALKEIKGDS